MQFLVLFLRFLLERLLTDRNDRLAMAARADGRTEQFPTRWTEWARQCTQWMNAASWRYRSTKNSARQGDGARQAAPQTRDRQSQ